MITEGELKSLLDYNVITGVFTRKVRTSNSINIGDVAGNDDGAGYIQISLKGKTYRAHRLAWLYCHGEFPSDSIDHINGVKDDNRIANLREANCEVNSKNSKLRSDNKSGVMGVVFCKARGKYQVRISKNKKTIQLGYFDNLEDAKNTRLQAELKYGYHENHGRLK